MNFSVLAGHRRRYHDGMSTPGPDLDTIESPQLLSLRQPKMLYQNQYAWFLFLAAMDIMMTWIILGPPFDGLEVNWLADQVIQFGGLRAMIGYKFALVVLVIVICEVVGRRNRGRGRLLANMAVILTAFPVVVAFVQLVIDVHAWANMPVDAIDDRILGMKER